MQTPTAATNAVAVRAGNGDSAVAVTFGDFVLLDNSIRLD